jgi:hypothetical protein
MRQRSNATSERRWDIMPHNVLLDMRKKKHHAHAANTKKQKSKHEEFVFVSALTGSITQGSDTWLIDSGASKHMT